MNKPLITVVMPAYKAEEFLLEALMSVKAQTYTEWELIVVEDGSKDCTEEIVKDFASSLVERNIQYVHHSQNQGVSAARNTAIKLAKGEFLAFLDSDDIWKEYHLELSIRELQLSGADLAHSAIEVFNNKTRKTIIVINPSDEEIADFPNSFFKRCYVLMPTVVVKRSIFQKLGDFDQKIKIAEDYDYWLRIVEAGFKFVYVPGIHALYRKNITSLTTSFTMVLGYHCLVLRKHSNSKIIPRETRNYAISKYHVEVALRNLKNDPKKSIESILWTFQFAPISSFKELVRRLLDPESAKEWIDFTLPSDKDQ